MENIERKDTIKNYWFLYFLTVLLAIAMKFFCRITDSDLLTWILALPPGGPASLAASPLNTWRIKVM